MIVSRLGPGGRVTVPRSVRSTLNVGPGDALAYEVTGDGQVLVTKAPSADLPAADEGAAVQAAIDEYLASPGPSSSAEEVLDRIHARIDAKSRERDAA